MEEQRQDGGQGGAAGLPRLFVLRHAESEFNASNGVVDEVDCDLSPEGVAQARRLADSLMAADPDLLHFDLAIVSPLRRARRTLEESGIKVDSTSVRVSHLVRETRLDRCDFLEGEEVWPLHTREGEYGETVMWRESPEQVQERIEALWRYVMKEADELVATTRASSSSSTTGRGGGGGAKMLIVTHSDIMWQFTNRECDLLNAEMAEITHLLAARYKNPPLHPRIPDDNESSIKELKKQ